MTKPWLWIWSMQATRSAGPTAQVNDVPGDETTANFLPAGRI
jgi:hypothetical protein